MSLWSPAAAKRKLWPNWFASSKVAVVSVEATAVACHACVTYVGAPKSTTTRLPFAQSDGRIPTSAE